MVVSVSDDMTRQIISQEMNQAPANHRQSDINVSLTVGKTQCRVEIISEDCV